VVRLSLCDLQEATSTNASVVELSFSPFPLSKTGEPQVLSEGGIAISNPATKYTLPGILGFGLGFGVGLGFGFIFGFGFGLIGFGFCFACDWFWFWF
jgi:hypothetical protein